MKKPSFNNLSSVTQVFVVIFIVLIYAAMIAEISKLESQLLDAMSQVSKLNHSLEVERQKTDRAYNEGRVDERVSKLDLCKW